MGQKSFIAIALIVVTLLLGAVAAYAYDSSNEDRIANGVSVAGVDVGGLSPEEARVRVKRQVADRLEQPVTVTQGQKRFVLSAEEARLRTDVGGMVDKALEASRQGNIFSRVARDVTGGEEDARVRIRVSYSKAAAARLVARVRKGVDRPAQDAKLNFPSLTQVSEKDGSKLEAAKLERQVKSALLTPGGRREIEAPTVVTKPKVTRDQLASRYPAVLIIDRGAFQLRFYRNLKLAKTYKIAVGQVGLETPAGLYRIQNKAVNAAWSVPNSAWAGSLAGTVIPGGAPNNPLKARWMGIFDGAGIHGTDQVGSLGTAASHGCVRMAIPDVIELYDKVEVQTPVYIA
ncbi:MAG TPA: L,D-transpeptidase family protein [Thermoleophilaceae bacterium]|nr:L,D-transpeptidase family protein [Thermoleophilaceae bacterium]